MTAMTLRVLGVAGPVTKAWAEPEPPRIRLLLAAPAVGVLAALVLPEAPAGVNATVVVVAVAVAVVLATRARRRGTGRVGTTLTAVALGLGVVPAVRASDWLVVGCLAAAACLGGAAALGAKRWNAVLATVPLVGLAALRAVPWSARTVRRHGAPDVPAPAFTGLAIGVVSAAVVGALLASADTGFAAVLGHIGSWFRVDLLAARVVIATLFTLGVLALAFAASARLRTRRLKERAARHPAEWVTPLVFVALMIGLFLVVEATRFVDGTHASRAREGFGQLVVVTLIVLALVGWAGRSAAGKHRTALGVTGGGLLALTLLLAVSALRRLWLYQDQYGWTVTRLNAGAFELWVVAVLAGIAVAWLIRRTDLVPRAVAGSAGLGLLVVALAGPDAIVAAADVHRYEQGGGLDAAYLSRLSADAVPALMELPEPLRACALPRPDTHAPWYAWNLSRARADRLLATADPVDPGCAPRVRS